MNHYDYLDGYRESAGTVYIVDDDDAVRDSLKWLLEASNYHVELYDSGESFIAKYDPNTIAVLVLDIRMPGMSGLEVQEHLLQRKADIPIIFVTGHGDVTMAVQEPVNIGVFAIFTYLLKFYFIFRLLEPYLRDM